MQFRVLITAVLTASLIAIAGPSAQASPADPAARARAVLAERSSALGLQRDLSDLRTQEIHRGLAGHYVRFQQTMAGLPVVGADLIVALPDNTREQPRVSSRYQPAASPARGAFRLRANDARDRALELMQMHGDSLRSPPKVDAAYFRSGKELVPGWQVLVALKDPAETWLVAVGAEDGEIIFASDVLRRDDGRVFDPNPPKNSGGAIPPPSDCDSGSNESLLSTQYVNRPLLGINPAQDRLKGEFVDLTGPGIIGAYKPAGQANEPSGSYVYPCTDDRFEEVMVYHHVDTVQRKIQSLGFSGPAAIVDGPIPAHAHYFPDCNAFYDPSNRGLHFGDSDVCGISADAAEDGDVIVHEYGHAIQDSQIPAYGFGAPLDAEQASAMGEGFADFLTAAIFGDSCLGEWLSFGGTCLREMNNSNTYPADFEACRPFPPPGEPVEPHCAGLIWGGALWDLIEGLGGDQRARDLALTLVLESHFMQHPLSTFDEAASSIRQADQMLYGGAHASTIDAVFAARGVSTVTPIADFPYAYLRIDHTFRGNLDVDLLVGSTSSPICSIAVWNPSVNDSTDDLVGYVDLGGSPCEVHLPPTIAQPWYLRVRDVVSGQTGTLAEFEIALDGAQRCVATDVPIPIPDTNAFVYSQINCSTIINGSVGDDDGDGFSSAVETYLGTDPAVRCGVSGWPADLVSSGPSANRVDLLDISSFIAPARRLGTSPGDGAFNVRWDLKPGAIAGVTINLTDVSALVVLAPPMLGGQKAFGQFCP